MEIAEKIRINFNRGFFGKSMEITGLPPLYPAWTLKESGWIGVAVPLNHYYEFKESFAEVYLTTEKDVLINGISYDLLILACNSMNLRNEFAVVCENFVFPGENGEARKALIEAPANWWRNWKALLGNKSQNKEAYSILAELLTAEKLLKEGEHVLWAGADHSTHDIEADLGSVEVKSTITRYGYEITINSIYQMRPAEGKDLFLSFLRLERSEMGRSINDVVNSLKDLGYDAEQLESGLGKQGLERGRTARDCKYKIIEWKRYQVNETFPAITEFSFKDNRIPASVTKLNYTIDLSGIAGKNLLSI